MAVTLTEIAAASLHTDCKFCAVPPGQPCHVDGGVHYARIARAYRLGWIDEAAFTQAIHAAVVFTEATVLHPEMAS